MMKQFLTRSVTTLLRCASIETNMNASASRFPLCAMQTVFLRKCSSEKLDSHSNNSEKTRMRLVSSTPLKKRPHKKDKIEELNRQDNTFVTFAYATAESYDLSGIRDALSHQENTEADRLATLDASNVVHTSVRYCKNDEPREIFFFHEGVTVFWNCSELETNNTLEFLKQYEHNPYPDNIIHKEREAMTYSYNQSSKACKLRESHFALAAERDVLEKYTFSNALALSVKLGVWERRLEGLASAAQTVSDGMKMGLPLRLDKKQVTRQLGAMLLLRHRINVESDLLDTPDFYWERDEMERLYTATVAYFSIARRTRVLNSRLSHCVELTRLLTGWATDRQFVRLEWLIVALLVMSVVFESLYFVEERLATVYDAGRSKSV